MVIASSVGLGGGGAMYEPVISPHDPFLRFVSCDMLGLYRTTDAGANWEMVDGHQMFGHTSIAVVFHPTDVDTVYAYGLERGLRRSSDRGSIWLPVQPAPPAALRALAIDASGRLFAGTASGAFFLDGTWKPCSGVTGPVVEFVATGDSTAPVYVAGTASIWKANATLTTWTPAMGSGASALPAGPFRDFAGGRDPAGNVVLYALLPSTTLGGGGLWYSQDGGTTWSSAMNAGSGLNIEQGKPGHECEYPQYEHVAVLASDARVAYVTVCAARIDGRQYRVYKTTNGGANWLHVLNVDGSVPGSVPASPNVSGGWQDFAPFGWGNTGRGRGLGVGRSTDPSKHAALFTNNGVIYISDDSATSWRQAYTRQYPFGQGSPGPNQRWRSIGLEVTTSWNYYVSQDDPARHFLCYTDICLSRSEDGGTAWLPLRPQNYNTIYELVFDAQAPAPAPGQHRQLWAAASELHDIPHWTYLFDDPYVGPENWAGSVRTSTDGGTTWPAYGTGLPNAPVLSIAADDSTPPTLWAAVWGAGVYRYDKASGAWQLKNGTATNLLGHGANKHVLRLHWAPEPGNAAGRLYCVITGRRLEKSQTDPAAGPTYNSDSFLDDKGGIWLSADGGDNWSCLTTNLGEAARYPLDFTVDPADKNRIYLCVGSVPKIQNSANTVLQAGLTGGLYVTTNAGAAWSEVSSFRTTAWAKGYDPDWLHAFAPLFDPHDPKKLWVTTNTHGTWVTEDVTAATPTWVEYRNIPFLNTHRMSFARRTALARNDSADIFLTTFGGGAFRLERRIFFILDRSAFSEWDVASAPVASGKRTFKNALYVLFDGFLPSELGIPAGPAPAVPAALAPQLTLKRRSTGQPPVECTVVRSATEPFLAEIDPIPDDLAQRFTFVYDVEFTGATGTADFPSTSEDFIDVTAAKGPLSTSAAIKLFRQPNPFMLHGPTPWFSGDLRVLRATSGTAPFAGAPTFTGTTVADALSYLSSVLATLNAAPQAGHPFDGIGDTVLSLRASDPAGNAVFNFAIARVRFVPPTFPVPDPLRVFFRTFRTQSTSFDYRAATYPVLTANAGHPVAAIGTGVAREVVTIPYYDKPRAKTAQTETLKDQTETSPSAIPGTGGSEQWRFFGSLLDFNQTTTYYPDPLAAAPAEGPWTGAKSLIELVRGRHQCLVAEINYAPDPLNPNAAPAETPYSSDNLAQRNLAISESANPGTPASRTVQHTFEVLQTRRPRRVEPDAADDLGAPEWGRPDELMLWWNVPAGTKATLCLNPDDARQILELVPPLEDAPLKRAGSDAISCLIGDVTYVPLPRSPHPVPVLLTIELPAGVTHGERFSVVARQVSGETRQVVGSFELAIPVRPAREILPDEEDSLAIFRWIQRSVGDSDRWALVLRRYVDQMAERVRAFGGDPERIEPSPNGVARDRQAGCLVVALRALAFVVLLALIWLAFR